MELQNLLAIIRILFASIFLVKLFFSYKAHYIVWGHREGTYLKNNIFHFLIYLQFGSLFLFLFGCLTEVAILILFITYIFLNRRASLYGLEDIVFQLFTFYFIFAGSGSVYSFDHFFKVNLWGRFLGNNYLPEYALLLASGMVFLSAGVEKLKSPMWKKGLGAYYFFLIPQFRRISTTIFTKRKWFVILINFSAIFFQLGMLIAFLVNALPLSIPFWFFAVSFAVLLSTVFVLTWIGECLILIFCINTWTLYHLGTSGVLQKILACIDTVDDQKQYYVFGIVFLTLFSSLWAVLVPSGEWVKSKKIFSFLHRFFRFISRHSWGLSPLKVFTELHLEGPVIYRVFVDIEGKNKEVMKIFGENCQPGEERAFRPAFFEVTSYKVTEACMEYDEYGIIKTKDRRLFIENLSKYVRDIAFKKFKKYPDSVLFKIKQIYPKREFVGSDDWYLREPWLDAIKVVFKNGSIENIDCLSRPILKYPTGRSLDRNSFHYNPFSS